MHTAGKCSSGAKVHSKTVIALQASSAANSARSSQNTDGTFSGTCFTNRTPAEHSLIDAVVSSLNLLHAPPCFLKDVT